MNINSMGLEEALKVLGQLLTDRGQNYEIVVIGGGGLLLMKHIDRTTKDLDLVALIEEGELTSADPLPKELLEAANEVGRALDLGNEWLNNGPTSLLDLDLPDGFMDRVHTRHFKGLTVHLASRFDQICFKLYATVDQGPRSKHFTDLLTLKPTMNELEFAKHWCMTHDPSENFRNEMGRALEAIHEVS